MMKDKGFAKFEDNIQVPIIQVETKRPSYVPEHWYVFNAYRPLAGSTIFREAIGYGALIWTDYRGPHGMHFAAVSPDDKNMMMWIKMNARDDARLIQYKGDEKDA
jgi:hypothetical protein